MGVAPLHAKNSQSNHIYSLYSVVRRDTANNLLYLESKQTGKEFVMKELTTNDDRAQFKVQELIKHKRSRTNPLLRLEDAIEEDVQEYCHYRFKVHLIFQNPQKDLKTQILQRRMKGKEYSEQELINMLSAIVQALKFLKQIDQPHEAVCSRNVFVLVDGECKLSDPWLKSSNLDQLPSYHIYHSPQRLRGTVFLEPEGYDWYLSDLYSLGILGLEMYSLQFMDGLYENRTLNNSLLQERVNSIRLPKFRKFIKGLTGPQRLRYQTVSEICCQCTKKIHVSPPKRDTGSISSPRNNKVTISSSKYYSPSVHTLGGREHHHRSPSLKKTIPRLNHPPNKRNNLTAMQISSNGLNAGHVLRLSNPCLFRSHKFTNYEETVGSNPEKRTVLQQRNYRLTGKEVEVSPFFEDVGGDLMTKLSSGFYVNGKQSRMTKVDENYSNSTLHVTKQSKESLKQSVVIPEFQLIPPYYPQAEPPCPRYVNRAKEGILVKEVIQVSEPAMEAVSNSLSFGLNTFRFTEGYDNVITQKSKITYSNGSSYQGHTLKGFKNGFGLLFSPSGVVIYDGQWQDDKYQGHGILSNSYVSSRPNLVCYQDLTNVQYEWTKYEGDFVRGRKCGYGRMEFVNGEAYEGQFLDDVIHGAGVYSLSDGTSQRGYWNNGLFLDDGR